MVQSKPGQRELVRAFNNLKRGGFETFLPWLWRKKPGRGADRIPLFPYYGFVVAKEQWRAVNSTPGVLRILTVDDRPAVIDTGIVEALQRQSDAHQGAVRLRETFRRRWRPDMQVKIIDGPFRGYVGKVLNMSDGKGRVDLLIDIMNRSAVVSTREGDLQQ